jgi:hypothetical protein
MIRKVVLISLIGHQPLPNLLTLRYIKPDAVMFIHSNSRDTQLNNRKEWLSQLAKSDGVAVIEPSSGVNPWSLNSVTELLDYDLLSLDLTSTTIIFDITGGTKAMAVGLTKAAEKIGGELIYLETEKDDNRLHRCRVTANGDLVEVGVASLPKLVTLQDFFFIHLGLTPDQLTPAPSDPTKKGIQFESAVRSTFAGLVDDLLYSIKPLDVEEIDIVLQKRNRFAIVECKARGDDERKAYGILQLNNLASERYLGTYTGKILATIANYSRDSSPNFKMAKEHRVHLLELPNWQPGYTWNAVELQEFERVIHWVFAS